MTLPEVVRTRHHIHGFLPISLILKIETKLGPDARHHGQERKKENIAKSKGFNSDCNIETFL